MRVSVVWLPSYSHRPALPNGLLVLLCHFSHLFKTFTGKKKKSFHFLPSTLLKTSFFFVQWLLFFVGHQNLSPTKTTPIPSNKSGKGKRLMTVVLAAFLKLLIQFKFNLSLFFFIHFPNTLSRNLLLVRD